MYFHYTLFGVEIFHKSKPEDPMYSEACSRLTQILDQNGIKYKFIKSTKDIWCRDYLPIQLNDDMFIQFRYEPPYIPSLTAQDSLPRTSYINCIDLKDSNQFIGLIALNLKESKFQCGEIWFKINPTHWGRGYATEALNKILDFRFHELNLHRIEAGCGIENEASITVMEKVGMIREGLKRKILPIRGEWVDAYSYAILKEEFNEKNF